MPEMPPEKLVYILQQSLEHQKGTNIVVSRPVVEQIVAQFRKAHGSLSHLPPLLSLIGDDDRTFPLVGDERSPAPPAPTLPLATLDTEYMKIDDRAFTGMVREAEKEQAKLLAQLKVEEKTP